MSKISKLIDIDGGQSVAPEHDPDYQDVKAEDELDKAMKAFYEEDRQKALTAYTTEELQDEVWRRTFEPLNTALARLKEELDTINGSL